MGAFALPTIDEEPVGPTIMDDTPFSSVRVYMCVCYWESIYSKGEGAVFFNPLCLSWQKGDQADNFVNADDVFFGSGNKENKFFFAFLEKW